jgi:uncharacterized protein (TIGR02145 family)
LGESFDESKEFCDPSDGNVYQFKKIGSKTWMAENLNYEAPGSECYNNDISNCSKYGRLYYWDIAMNACPPGWSLPSNDDWEALINVVEKTGNVATVLKSTTSDWYNNSKGTDMSGFAALPAGYYTGYAFSDIERRATWWTAKEESSIEAWRREIHYLGSTLSVVIIDKTYYSSVRCIKNGN